LTKKKKVISSFVDARFTIVVFIGVWLTKSHVSY